MSRGKQGLKAVRAQRNREFQSKLRERKRLRRDRRAARGIITDQDRRNAGKES